jgi:hypothetical protein
MPCPRGGVPRRGVAPNHSDGAVKAKRFRSHTDSNVVSVLLHNPACKFPTQVPGSNVAAIVRSQVAATVDGVFHARTALNAC